MTDYRDDYKPEPIRQAPHYGAALVGRGRWVTLEAPLGRPAVRLYTNDQDTLAWLQVGDHDEALALVQTLAQALMSAKAADAPTTVVFDRWAQQASQSVAAGQVVEGDLITLSPTRADTR